MTAWRRAAATRAGYLAAPTARMLDLARIRPGDRVLAIGVGIGEEAIAAAPLVEPNGEVVATDASAAMIAEARRAVARSGLRNISCLCLDAQKLDFEPQSFDAIIARNALMFIPELPQALEQMRRVLRAGGRISATVWSAWQRNPRLFDPLRLARAFGAAPPPESTFRVALRLGQPRILSNALRSAGFSDVEVDAIPVVASYATVEAAVEQAMELGGTHELLALLPPGSELRMRTLLAERWQRFRDAGGVRLPGEQLVFAATS